MSSNTSTISLSHNNQSIASAKIGEEAGIWDTKRGPVNGRKSRTFSITHLKQNSTVERRSLTRGSMIILDQSLTSPCILCTKEQWVSVSSLVQGICLYDSVHFHPLFICQFWNAGVIQWKAKKVCKLHTINQIYSYVHVRRRVENRVPIDI